jgi:ABC-type transporter Mla maintaining outer membrane lipid asymmetry ATPase subunit MlaF
MLVKKDLVKLAIVLIAGTALLSAVCFAAEPTPGAEPPKMVKVQGMVNVTKDANDVITKVTVVTKDKAVYNVTLDVKGLELGKAMANKEVEVEGTVSKRGIQEWIKVQSYKAVEKAPEAAPVPKPAPKPAPKTE